MKYEKWSFGYWVLKKIVSFAEFTIYKKIVINGKDKIPRDKPIVFAPNHQNALSDPMAVLLYTPYQPVWLARADIFKNKMAARFLRFIKIMPVYRIRDGKDQLSKNDQTFENSVKVLEKHGALALFPEAAHSGRRQMLAHKKAVPRIVFMAEEKAEKNLDIQIIPTGIFYTSYWKFNRSVVVNFGDAVPVNDFIEEYKNNPNAATLALRDKLYTSIDDLTINIRSKNYYNEFELIREYYGRTYLGRQHKTHTLTNQFYSDQQLTRKLDGLESEQPELAKSLADQAAKYQHELQKMGLRSWLFAGNKKNFLKLVGSKLLLLLGLPFFIYGFVFNDIPFFAIDTLVRKKVKDIAFWSTFSLLLGIVLFPPVYLLELWVVSALLPALWLKLLFSFSLPFAGKIAFLWYRLMLKTWGRAKLFLMKNFRPKVYGTISDMQKRLFAELDKNISA